MRHSTSLRRMFTEWNDTTDDDFEQTGDRG
jgi:hypothetical protein